MATENLPTIARRMFLQRAPLYAGCALVGTTVLPTLLAQDPAHGDCDDPPCVGPCPFGYYRDSDGNCQVNVPWTEDGNTGNLRGSIASLLQRVVNAQDVNALSTAEWMLMADQLGQLAAAYSGFGNIGRMDAYVQSHADWLHSQVGDSNCWIVDLWRMQGTAYFFYNTKDKTKTAQTSGFCAFNDWDLDAASTAVISVWLLAGGPEVAPVSALFAVVSTALSVIAAICKGKG